MSSYYEDPHQNPYWQNLNGDGPQDDMNRQNTRNTDPNWHPEQEYGRQLGKTAALLGGFSIVTCFFLPVIVPAILGGVAIVMAVLSRGRGRTFTRSARHGLVLGTIGLSINLAILAAVIVMSWQMVSNPAVREQANQVMEQLYGFSFDDMLEQVEQDAGLSLPADAGEGNAPAAGESPEDQTPAEESFPAGGESFAEGRTSHAGEEELI